MLRTGRGRAVAADYDESVMRDDADDLHCFWQVGRSSVENVYHYKRFWLEDGCSVGEFKTAAVHAAPHQRSICMHVPADM